MINFVYLTTNTLNGKQYIGSHPTLNENDKYFGSGLLIKKALVLYGKNNFERKILKKFKDINEARQSEKEFIIKYNTLQPNGYNISPNGGTSNGGHTEETKRKISNNRKGKGLGNTFWKGKKRPDISNKMLGENNPMYGKPSPLLNKPLPEETKKKNK